jgi:hypothetical protein
MCDLHQQQKIITRFDPPPIPIRAFDWSAVTDNYEPGNPVGYGYTEQQAVEDLTEQLAEIAS